MLQELIGSRIDTGQLNISWDDISGMSAIKKLLHEIIYLPREIPHLYVGNRSPIRSILLYGPPGTGKTFLAKAVASSNKSSFYSISSAEIVSKFVGESEKYVKSLFEMLKQDKPCTLFLDEVEALCARREESTQIKTVQQFLVQLDGLSTTGSMDGILIIACTNAPWSLDEAMIRRLEKRIYIRLPDCDERERHLSFYLSKNESLLTIGEIRELALATEYYSTADIQQLVKAASMIPLSRIREAEYFELLEDGMLRPCDKSYATGMPMSYTSIVDKQLIQVSPISYSMMKEALLYTKSTVDKEKLAQYEQWTLKHGQ